MRAAVLYIFAVAVAVALAAVAATVAAPLLKRRLASAMSKDPCPDSGDDTRIVFAGIFNSVCVPPNRPTLVGQPEEFSFVRRPGWRYYMTGESQGPDLRKSEGADEIAGSRVPRRGGDTGEKNYFLAKQN
jgi:hypothetical protein